jgi:hypothetical protein
MHQVGFHYKEFKKKICSKGDGTRFFLFPHGWSVWLWLFHWFHWLFRDGDNCMLCMYVRMGVVFDTVFDLNWSFRRTYCICHQSKRMSTHTRLNIFLVSCLKFWLPRRYEARSLHSHHILKLILRCPTSFNLPQHEHFSVISFWCLGGAGKESISFSFGCWDLCEVGTVGLGQPSTAFPTPGAVHARGD